MEKVNCIICSRFNDNTILKIDNTKNNNFYSLSKCYNCDLVYLNPRIKENDIYLFYENNYLPHRKNADNVRDFIYFQFQRLTFIWKRKILSRYSFKNRSLLDIGSGNGSFCKYMNENKWSAKSYDKYSDLSDFKNFDDIRSNSFDCITLWHSIEHIYDLHSALEKINEILKKNGTIFIACPNFKAVEMKYFNDTWAAIDAPRHLYHFTFNSMKELLKKHNIKIIRTHRMLQDTFFNIYKSRKYSFLYKFILSICSFFIIIFNKRKSSSLLFVCKPIK